jgi:hypothetical protein
MASKKTKAASVPKKAPAILKGSEAPAKAAEPAPAKAPDTPAPKAADAAAAKPADTAPAKAEAGESAAPKNYSRGEGQKPVTQAYKDNWNLIFGKGAKKKKR